MIALLTTVFKGESSSPVIQFCRYVLVGGLSFLVDFATLFVLYRFVGLHYLVAATIGFLVGLASIYTCSILYVFNHRSLDNPVYEFLVFGLLGVVGLGITLLTMYLLTGVFGAEVLFSKVVAAAVTFAWNFLSRKLLLFTSFSAEPA